jgi:hypothetical protein
MTEFIEFTNITPQFIAEKSLSAHHLAHIFKSRSTV